MSENKFLKQAKEELAYLSDDPDFQRLLEARVGMLRDMYSLEQKGNRDGKIEIAKRMKAKNMSIEDIIELTGLSKDEIKNL